MFTLEFTVSAVDDLRYLPKVAQRLVLAASEQQLSREPLIETRNRKPIRHTDLAEWELRVEKYRLFYDVNPESRIVTIKAVGWKEHNTLFIRHEEFKL